MTAERSAGPGFVVFVAGEPEGGAIRDNVFVFDLTTYELVRVLEDSLTGAVAVADGTVVVSAWDSDSENRLWRLSSGRLLPLYEGKTLEAGEVVWDGSRLVWAEGDDDVRGFGAYQPRRRIRAGRLSEVGPVIYEGKRRFLGPALGDDGRLLVVEVPDTPRWERLDRCVAVVVGGGAEHRVPLGFVPRGWYVQRPVALVDNRAVIAAEHGPDEDSAAPSTIVVDIDSGEFIAGWVRVRSIAVLPGGQLLGSMRAGQTTFLVGLSLDGRREWVQLARIQDWWPRRGVWSASAPGGLTPVGAPSRVDDLGGAPVPTGEGAALPQLEGIGVPVGYTSGIWMSQASRERLEEYGGDIVVQVRVDEGDRANTAAALAAARDDLYLQGDITGADEVTSSWVSDVRTGAAGPWLVIDSHDTGSVRLRRIPGIVSRHLTAHGVGRAEIIIGDGPDEALEEGPA